MSSPSKTACLVCNKEIKKDLVERSNYRFHTDCCKCFKCKTDLTKAIFYFNKGRLLCEKDYEDDKNLKCNKCKGVIVEDRVTDSGFYYHKKCFVCHVCKKQLTGKYYKVKGSGKDEYLFTCIDDYNQSYGASCALCSKIIEGKGIVIEGLGSVIHAECCKCQSCDQIIKPGVELFWKNDLPLCASCSDV